MQDTGPEIQEAERALAAASHELRTAGTAWAILTNLDDTDNPVAKALERTEDEHHLLARNHVEHAFRVLGRYLRCSPEGLTALLSDADFATDTGA